MSGEVATTTPGAPAADPLTDDVPRVLKVTHSTQDLLFIHGARATGFVVLVIVSAIGIFLGVPAFPTLDHYGLSIFT